MDRQQDFPQFTAVIAKLKAAFPDREVMPQTVEQYWEDLSDLSIERVEQAATACRKSCNFFPRIAEIRESAQTLESIERMKARELERASKVEQVAVPSWDSKLPGYRDERVLSEVRAGIREFCAKARLALKGTKE